MSVPAITSNSAPTARALASASALGTLLLARCSGSSVEEGTTTDDAASTQSTTTGDAAGSPADELPDGFPEDVPLPAYSGSHTLGTQDGDSDFHSSASNTLTLAVQTP